jgi:HK97 gp10 family phage protein
VLPIGTDLQEEYIYHSNVKSKSRFKKARALIGSGLVSKILTEEAEGISEDAKSRAPEDKGNLKRSVRVEKKGYGASIIADDPAAITQEFGTIHHPAQPFMRPAFERKATKVISKVEKRVRQALRDIGG